MILMLPQPHQYSGSLAPQVFHQRPTVALSQLLPNSEFTQMHSRHIKQHKFENITTRVG